MRKPFKVAAALLGGLIGAGSAQAQPAADTVAAIRARGAVSCAVAPASAGFALPDARGIYAGLDVDMCRAVAAAILNDASKVRYVPATPSSGSPCSSRARWTCWPATPPGPSAGKSLWAWSSPA